MFTCLYLSIWLIVSFLVWIRENNSLLIYFSIFFLRGGGEGDIFCIYLYEKNGKIIKSRERRPPRPPPLCSPLSLNGLSYCIDSGHSVMAFLTPFVEIDTVLLWFVEHEVRGLLRGFLSSATADFMKKVPSVYTHSMKTIYLSIPELVPR